MRKFIPFLIPTFLIIGLVCLFSFLLKGTNIAVLNPQGIIAFQEKNLIVFAISIMLGLALPVLAVTFFIAWKYRANNTKAAYTPEWTGNVFLKILWWAILCAYVVVFFVIVWKAAHELDPYKPISSSVKPIEIQVVALQWKWLFIYPKEHIATVNFVEFPAHTPVTFKLTADAPMTSFWIPNVSGQIYAMPTMETQLHVLSDKTGDFPGEDSEINGDGYAGMKFVARVSSEKDFTAWVKHVLKTAKPLDLATYNKLVKPSQDAPVMFYAPVDKDLYNEIIIKYMVPSLPPGKKQIIPLRGGMDH